MFLIAAEIRAVAAHFKYVCSIGSVYYRLGTRKGFVFVAQTYQYLYECYLESILLKLDMMTIKPEYLYIE